jgi:hypothetical protein
MFDNENWTRKWQNVMEITPLYAHGDQLKMIFRQIVSQPPGRNKIDPRQYLIPE